MPKSLTGGLDPKLSLNNTLCCSMPSSGSWARLLKMAITLLANVPITLKDLLAEFTFVQLLVMDVFGYLFLTSFITDFLIHELHRHILGLAYMYLYTSDGLTNVLTPKK